MVKLIVIIDRIGMNKSLSEQIKIRSSNINLLRFIAAISVIFCHSFAVSRNAGDPLNIIDKGQCNVGGVAVAVFFFLSGLYVTKSLEKDVSLFTFFKKRCMRIFPQLWITVLVCVFVLGPIITCVSLKEYFGSEDTYKYLLNMVLLPVHNLPGVFNMNAYQTVNGPLWTMPVEFAAYIGLMILAAVSERLCKLNGRINRKRLNLLVVCLLIVIYLFTVFYLHNQMLISIARPMLIFYEGVMYYDYREKITLNPIFGIVALIVLFAFAQTFVFSLLFVLLLPYGILSITLGFNQVPINWMVLITSYEMYLVGWPIQQVVQMINHNLSPVENWLITIPIDILLGLILYKLTEKIVRYLPNKA